MALYNEIGIGRWNRFIQKLTDMKGNPPAPQLASEIQFSHTIFSGAENRYLESWERFAIGILSTAIAGQTSALRLNNPAVSNMMVVVEKIAFGQDGPPERVTLMYGTPGGDLSLPQNGVTMDPRGRAFSSAVPSINAGAHGTLNPVGEFIVGTNLVIDFIVDGIQEIAVPPGAAIQIEPRALNQNAFYSVFWRERFLEPAERK